MENSITITIPYKNREEYEEMQRKLISDEVKKCLQGISQPEKMDKFLSRKELAKVLHISLPTLHNLTKTGKLKGYRLNGRVLYRWEDVNEALIEIPKLKYRGND